MPGNNSSPSHSMRRKLCWISCLTVLDVQPLARRSAKLFGLFGMRSKAGFNCTLKLNQSITEMQEIIAQNSRQPTGASALHQRRAPVQGCRRRAEEAFKQGRLQGQVEMDQAPHGLMAFDEIESSLRFGRATVYRADRLQPPVFI